jgi:hypothetical protein
MEILTDVLIVAQFRRGEWVMTFRATDPYSESASQGKSSGLAEIRLSSWTHDSSEPGSVTHEADAVLSAKATRLVVLEALMPALGIILR